MPHSHQGGRPFTQPRPIVASLLTILAAASLTALPACEQAKDGSAVVRLGDRKFKVRGVLTPSSFLKQTGKTKQAAAAEGRDLSKEAHARIAFNRERERSPRPKLTRAAPWVDLTPLRGHIKADRKRAASLVGKVVRCQINNLINFLQVGDANSKAGQTLLARRSRPAVIGPRYAKLRCEVNPRSKRTVELLTFLPRAHSPSIHWLYAGGVVNVELIGQLKGQNFGILAGYVKVRKAR